MKSIDIEELNTNELITASQAFEEKLLKVGLTHEAMFHLREVLYDVQSFKVRLTQLFSQAVIDTELPQHLDDFVTETLYGMIPHTQSHLAALDELLEQHTSPVLEPLDKSHA